VLEVVFPISIGPLKVDMGMEDARGSVPLICTCQAPPPVFVRIGFGAGFL
jgi:conjugal transfer pilus assembly protein TraU